MTKTIIKLFTNQSEVSAAPAGCKHFECKGANTIDFFMISPQYKDANTANFGCATQNLNDE